MGAVSRLENGCGFGRWGFDSLSFRFDPARSNGYDARLLIAKSRFEPCRRSSLIGGRCPWRHGSLIPSRAWFDSTTSD
jgi:hypothetical protein